MFHSRVHVKEQLKLISVNELINKNMLNYLDGVGETHQYIPTPRWH